MPQRHSAFTLIELVVTVALLALLATIAYPSYQNVIDGTKSKHAVAEIYELQLRIDRYLLDNDMTLPDTLADIGKAGASDPWGTPYEYLNLATVKGNGKKRKDHNLVPINSDYDLYSKGPDAKSVSPLQAAPSRDDIVRGRNGTFIGVATEY
jgi:general secretion pathway protein G